ncbi:hypothetical protein INT47_011396 [Mucor saturninus]|uniref:Endonuclease/exonuclease/phosphatase domain-containing protein n=1 Tax=Mucor saturninus TaxID=64648 RepID=A0A8H7UMH5_9FUNG|nr:hypothetical protein INT47_011396 [Mucor saturninus]
MENQQAMDCTIESEQPNLDLGQLQKYVYGLASQVNEHSTILKEMALLKEKVSTLEKENMILASENKILKEKFISVSSNPGASKTTIPQRVSNQSTEDVNHGSSSKDSTWATKTAETRPEKTKSTSPASSLKKRIAAARPFQSTEDKGPQGFQYVYIGRSRKIIRSEVRSRLRRTGIDTGRILDVTFPASGVLGLLMHVQYVKTFTDAMNKVDATLYPNFDPLDPKHLADPRYSNMTYDERCQKMHDIVNSRAIDTLTFLRPLVVGPVARSFVDFGWIDDEDAKDALAGARKKLDQVDPRKAAFYFKNTEAETILWNANGLRATTIQDVLSHVTNSDLLFITETWLTAGYLPANWSQYHLYGTLVSNGNSRGSGGVSCFVSPQCPIPVTQLPSPNAYTLSMKIDSVNVHCSYFPPSLSRELVLSALRSIPLGSDTILCGDFNARLGPFTGDSITTPRGADLTTWCVL